MEAKELGRGLAIKNKSLCQMTPKPTESKFTTRNPFWMKKLQTVATRVLFSREKLKSFKKISSNPLLWKSNIVLTKFPRLVESLAKQNLPKCHPDVFNGDATMFHPWKRAMIRDTAISLEGELNYLYKYTTGDPRRVLDGFRKRQYSKPEILL